MASLFIAGLGVAAYHGQLNLALRPVLISAAVFMGGWAALVFAARHAESHGAISIAILAAFMTADLAIGNGPNRSTAKPPALYEELRPDTGNDTIAFLKSHAVQAQNSLRHDRVEMVGLGFEWPNVSLIHDFDHMLGYNPLRLGVIEQGMGATETVAELWQRKFTPLFPSYRSLMADYLGLRYIAAKKPIEEVDKRLKPGDLTLVARSKDAYIYENTRALPRLIFATDWLQADFERLEKDGRWPNFDPMRTVLLRNPPPRPSPSLSMPVALTKAAITLDAYRNTEIAVEVDAPKAGYLVLNDIWHPWWFGSVDGKPADILQANVLFRAIQVPAGKHVVRFEFRPVEGAIKEVRARLKGKPAPDHAPAPGDSHPRPEASAEGVLQAG
jgi:hypothetical protein